MKLSRAKHAADDTTAVGQALQDDAENAAFDQLIAQQLVAAEWVTLDVVTNALNEAQAGGRRLGRVLVEQGVIDEQDLVLAVAAAFSVPVVDFRVVTPTAEAVALMNETTARSLAAVPIALDGETVHVAVADPSPPAVDRVSRVLGHPVFVAVASPGDIQHAIDGSFRAINSVDTQVQAFEARDVLRKDTQRLESIEVNEDAPVVQVVQSVITQALRDRASDIHIEPADDRIRVRYRVDGALHDVISLPGSIGPAVISRVKIMAGLNIVERRRPQDGQISMHVDSREVDIRVSTTAVVGGEKVVLRLLDKSRPLYALPQLGMPPDVTARWEALLRSPYGMVICAGPTGSGKTTTLYASLGELNHPERNIMTIEDPVEYTVPTINQIQIHEQSGITFANGLRSILRQDPDIILVGEVRDVETARIAVQSALTGHFVLSSLHATDSIAALYRLLDMGIESFLVASSITAVVAQRLVRRTCTHCVQSYEPSVEEFAFLEQYGGVPPVDGFTRGGGCNFCSQTGYLERIGVYELLPITDEVRELIIERGSHEEMRKLAKVQGMRTLQEESLTLVSNGITTLAEVMRSIYVAGM